MTLSFLTPPPSGGPCLTGNLLLSPQCLPGHHNLFRSNFKAFYNSTADTYHTNITCYCGPVIVKVTTYTICPIVVCSSGSSRKAEVTKQGDQHANKVTGDNPEDNRVMGILWRWLHLHSFLGDTGSLRSYQLITVGIEPRARKKKKKSLHFQFF